MLGDERTHSTAAASGSSTTSSIRPADFALRGSESLPSRRKGEAAMAPILRASRVVPPMPGKMPTRISGRPILALGSSAQKMRWQASGISSPMPSAVPGRAAAMGLPPLLVFASMPARSIFRRMAWERMRPSKRPRAGSSPASSFILAMTLRSMPPAKLPGLPEVMTAPRMASSDSTASMQASSSSQPARLRTFMDLPGTSQVMMATPSPRVVMVKSVM